jgi:hypothetical protein
MPQKAKCKHQQTSLGTQTAHFLKFKNMFRTIKDLRPVFNNMSLLPGVKFASRGEVGPQGLTLSPREMLTPLITSSCEYSLLFRRMEGWTVDLYPWGSKFSPGTILKICHSQLMLNPWRYGLGFPGLSSIYYWGILRLEILQILWHHR